MNTVRLAQCQRRSSIYGRTDCSGNSAYSTQAEGNRIQRNKSTIRRTGGSEVYKMGYEHGFNDCLKTFALVALILAAFLIAGGIENGTIF